MKQAILGILVALPAFAAGGTIKGSVAFSGNPPPAKTVSKVSDANCGDAEAPDEAILLTRDGKALQNVVVRVKDAPAGEVPKTPVVIDQKECMYRPRVQAAVEGQKISVKNSDGTLHNVHTYLGKKNFFNIAQTPGQAPIEKAAPAGADVIRLKCDVHPWMAGWVVVNKSPHFAVSGDKGSFEIKNVPPGKYTLEAWHEKLGTQTAEVTVADGKTATANFTFQGK
jgi:plastocyanin